MYGNDNYKKKAEQQAIAAELIRLGKSQLNAPKRQRLNENYYNAAYPSQYVDIQNPTLYMTIDPVTYNLQTNNTVYSIPNNEITGQASNVNVHDQQLMQVGQRNLRDEVLADLEYSRAMQIYMNQQNNANQFYPSSSIHQHTPSFDLTAAANNYTNSFFSGYYQPIHSTPIVQETARIQHRAPLAEVKPLRLSKKTSLDHNYATATKARSVSKDLRPVLTTNSDRPSTAYTSDSGKSSISEDVHPIALHDWYMALIKDELMGEFQAELGTISHRSELFKQSYMQLRMEELPTDLEYYPNKSRLRKAYDSPGEAAIRLRNNFASRKSRFKKKIAQQLASIESDFDRTENFRLLSIFDYMNDIIYQLETKWLNSGATCAELRKLRQFCGFPPAYYK